MTPVTGNEYNGAATWPHTTHTHTRERPVFRWQFAINSTNQNKRQFNQHTHTHTQATKKQYANYLAAGEVAKWLWLKHVSQCGWHSVHCVAEGPWGSSIDRRADAISSQQPGQHSHRNGTIGYLPRWAAVCCVRASINPDIVRSPLIYSLQLNVHLP